MVDFLGRRILRCLTKRSFCDVNVCQSKTRLEGGCPFLFPKHSSICLRFCLVSPVGFKRNP